MGITMMYTGLLGLWFLALSVRVIQGRGSSGISLGDGGDALLQRRVRGHGNFAEYVPLILLMLGFLEYAASPAWLLHLLGATLLIARLGHGYALAFHTNFPPGRLVGTTGTLLALLVASLACLWQAAGSLA